MVRMHKGTAAKTAQAQVLARRERSPETARKAAATRPRTMAKRGPAASLEERLPVSAAAAYIGAEPFDYYGDTEEDNWLEAKAEVARLLGRF